MSERGLGTPATRAATIEGLISHKYLLREGRELHVTPSGLNLISLIEELDINTLSSPDMTGNWEHKLREMEAGHFKRDEFMSGILDFTQKMVLKAKKKADELKNQSFPDLQAPCPMCQAPTLKQTDATYECSEAECKFKAKKYIAGRPLTDLEAIELFTKKFVGPLSGFKSRFNQPFEAALELDEKFKVNFKFGDDEEEEELSEDQLIGTFAINNVGEHKVYETDKSVIVPDILVGKKKDPAKISRHILSRDLTREEILELLTKGKTPLLDGFVSKRTKRKFSAHLLYDTETGKVSFEFEPRAPSKKGARKSTKKATKKAAKNKSK